MIRKRLLMLGCLLLSLFLASCSEGIIGDDLKNSWGALDDTGAENAGAFQDDITTGERVDVTIDYVTDGDTLTIKNEHGYKETIRLLLVDTPESVHPDKPEELYASDASDYAKNLLKKGDTVQLERGEDPLDKYGRTLGYIWIGDTTLNQMLLEEGLARIAFIFEPNTKYLDELKQAESIARNNQKGVWSIDGYVTDRGFDMSVVN